MELGRRTIDLQAGRGSIMRIVLFRILLYVAEAVFVISTFIFLTSLYALACARTGKKCTQKGTATLIQVSKCNWRDAAQHFEIEYNRDGTTHRTRVPEEYAEEGKFLHAPPGTQLPIWYDPKKPDRIVIAEDPSMQKTVKSWRRIRKRCLILMLIFGCLTAYALPRSSAEEQTLPAGTTIGTFSDDIRALAEKTPVALVFTESIGAPETFSVTVDDPAIAREALDVILRARVSTQGGQVDMFQYQYEEYRFIFEDAETYTFGFLPHSYFCYGGQDYEIGENRLSGLCDSLHEMAAEAEADEAPRSKWYDENAVLRTRFVDNGDEARSVTILTLTADGETLTGAIEGAYDVLSIEKQPDGYEICYTRGDFYSHDAICRSLVTVEGGEMVITDLA